MPSTPSAPRRPKVGRPMAFTRDAAIESAMQLFWKRGFTTVTARDLAGAMSIRRSSFYNTFETREVVFREAMRRYGALAPDAPLDRVRPGHLVVPLLVSSLREVCRVRAADRQARGCLMCNSIAELVHVDQKQGPLIARAVRARMAKLRQLLRQAEAQAELRLPTGVAGSAEAFVAFLVGLNTISKVVRNERQLWAMCQAFLVGLGVPREATEDAASEAR